MWKRLRWVIFTLKFKEMCLNICVIGKLMKLQKDIVLKYVLRISLYMLRFRSMLLQNKKKKVI